MIRKIVAVTGLTMIGTITQAQETPTPESGTVIGAEMIPFSEDAVNRAFVSLTEDERFVIQQRLARRGFYQGTVDGTTGPGTRGAVRQQATVLVADGMSIRLDTEAGARAFLTGLLPMPTEELPEGDAFFGVWDCGVGRFSYRYDGYATDPDAAHSPYMSIEEFSPGTFGVTLMDGYRMGVFDVTPTTLTWSSPASGDMFECRRIAPAPPRLSVSSARVEPVLGTAEVRSGEIVTAPAPKPEPVQPAPIEFPAAEVLQVTGWPFEGDWSCLSGTFGTGAMAFKFGPDSVTVPVIGSTVGYADVTKIGGRETAYLVDLMDGQQAALVELETDRMVLFAAGNLFDCARESKS